MEADAKTMEGGKPGWAGRGFRKKCRKAGRDAGRLRAKKVWKIFREVSKSAEKFPEVQE